MFPSASLLAVVSLALSIAANPVVIRDSLVSLPIAKRFNFTSSARLIDHDQARATHLKALGTRKAQARLTGRSDDAVVSIPIVNELVNYAVNVSLLSFCIMHLLTICIVQVGVGTPATTCRYCVSVNIRHLNYWDRLALVGHRKLQHLGRCW